MTPSADAERLLVVDDEATVRELLSATLRFAGFRVSSAGTAAEAISAATAEPPDLVLLDVMLPDMDGFEVVRRLREHRTGKRGGPVPVLFLTARDRQADKVTGLSLGADDYVTKPFDLEELIARIRAILRRTGGSQAGLLSVGALTLDTEGHQVTRDGRPVKISPTEFRLLRYLMENAGRVVTKAQILDRVWHYDFGGDASIVDTYISYLRRKADTGDVRLIQTVHGVGYVMREPRR
ncbi:DNA-binding response regulator [Paractinoplanes abujensis]|uniref:Two-component system OmpR family response regulator n=1 Tax=Paractinoplanes abujensis TaxID=882441 RepID=A0A7W7CTB4_9ACTN|nr:response regulator transcription factor [Actinoplanes abujensis]MBB4692586.1 two-component system OmpR family response regulator [Actinoplanes abujensis]GID22914.1 DNA-binding response regulator [Actinoplanes abujensis]